MGTNSGLPDRFDLGSEPEVKPLTPQVQFLYQVLENSISRGYISWSGCQFCLHENVHLLFLVWILFCPSTKTLQINLLHFILWITWRKIQQVHFFVKPLT